jgi:uncharacterized cupin superfamily protein
MELRSTRRIVTGHDAQGKAVVVFDAPVQAKRRSAGGNGMTLLWVTTESPADVSGSSDRSQGHNKVPPPENGTVFRIVDFAPAAPNATPVDHHQILLSMGIDPATQGHARHANTHRTLTIDYALVLDGEIDMLLDDTQIHVKAGDVLVQQATNHAWVNNGTKPCRIAFILIDSKEPLACAPRADHHRSRLRSSVHDWQNRQCNNQGEPDGGNAIPATRGDGVDATKACAPRWSAANA